MRNCSGLAVNAAALHVDPNIVLTTHLGRVKRTHDLPFGSMMSGKILFKITFIDEKFAAARDKTHSSRRVFAPAGRPNRKLLSSGRHNIRKGNRPEAAAPHEDGKHLDRF